MMKLTILWEVNLCFTGVNKNNFLLSCSSLQGMSLARLGKFALASTPVFNLTLTRLGC